MGEMSKIEEVALAIHPHAFKSHASLYAYCLGNGDSPEEAAATANWAHPLDESFATAKAAIEAMRVPTKTMIDAADRLIGSGWDDQYEAVIDAALKE